MTDQLDPKEVVGRTFSGAAATYDEVVDFFGPFGHDLVEVAAVAPGERVLDVACGAGSSLWPAQAAVGDQGSVVGIDLAVGMVERMAAEVDARGSTNVVVRIGDAEGLDLPDASVDVVLGGFMVFFAPDPPRVLAELHRVVRPGGRVALTVFDGPGGFPWLAEVIVELFGEGEARPQDEFNKVAVLAPALVDAGFEDPSTTRVEHRFSFSGPDQVEEWMRSHGARLLFDALDDETLPRFRALLAERLEAHRVADGVELVQPACVVLAHRPAI